MTLVDTELKALATSTYCMKILKYDPCWHWIEGACHVHLLHENFKIWPLLTLNWRRSPRPVEEQPSRGEGLVCIWCHGLLFHNHL
jgi:hypothetical protein